LGVRPEYRDRGLGRALIRERMKLIDPRKYSVVVLRVSDTSNPSYDLYRSMGFEDMGVYMDVSARRIDGTTTTDRRLFLSRLLSQVEVESAPGRSVVEVAERAKLLAGVVGDALGPEGRGGGVPGGEAVGEDRAEGAVGRGGHPPGRPHEGGAEAPAGQRGDGD